MSITDELREWAHGFNGPWRRNEEMLLAIADRIDVEHERAVMSAMNDALYHAKDESMAELGWVRLPKDADGVPFRIGDKVSSDHYDNGTVIAIQYGPMANGAIMELVAVRPHGRDAATWYDPEEYRHHNTPTVEDVLREFGDWYAHTKGGCDEDGIIAEYAAKLRLAEREDA